MEKNEERNILTEGKEQSFISSILNAVGKDYSDSIIINDIVKLANSNEISKGILLSTPDALRSYGENFKNSLNFIANEIEVLNKKESACGCGNKQGECTCENQSGECNCKKNQNESNVVVEEDTEKYSYNEKENKISGLLDIAFNQDMRIYKQGSVFILKQAVKEHVRELMFNYLKSEYPKLKAKLSNSIFTSDLNFNDLKNGNAEISYEIKDAY